MEQFQKGDRVVYLWGTRLLRGKPATLINVEPCLLEFDEPWSPALHDGNGRGKPNHCWWTGFDHLQKIESSVSISSQDISQLL